jgi:nucleoside-diphosphate-sugar epimerase
MSTEIPPYVILGCGYVGTRLAQSLLADGGRVRVAARRVALLEPLRELGAEVTYFDAGRPHQVGPALLGLERPVVVYCIPGVPDLPQGEAVRRAATAALRMHARAFIYLGSSAVYGRTEEHLTSDWVDEDTAVASNDPDATLRLAEEGAVQAVAQAGLRAVVLRLAAIYGPALHAHQPARGVRQRLRTGQYKLWDGGKYYFSRIMVDDLVRIIRASADHAPAGATYVVGDDHPCTQGEYGRWLASHLGLPEPPSADSHQSRSASHSIRGRRLRNDRLKRELGLQLLYPSYKEGELQIDACEEAGQPLLAGLPPGRARPAAAAAAPPSEPPAAPPAPAVEAVADVPAGPTWPHAVPGEDLGQSAGLPPVDAVVVAVPPGQSAAPGPLYLVLQGRPSVAWQDQSLRLGPHALVPPGATVHNKSADTVLLLRLPARRPSAP